jgi:DNA-binding MarR family transcriptional regulator
MASRSEASREIVRLLPAVAINLRLAALFDLEAVDLTANQMLALMLVSSAPDRKMKAGEMAGRLGISLPAATALVDRLVTAGVVARSQGRDRRVVWVSITDDGLALLERLAAGLERRIDVTMENSDPAAVDSIVEGMRRVASFADLMIEPGSRSHENSPGAPKPPDQRGQAPP